jgi:hypothetical protein
MKIFVLPILFTFLSFTCTLTQAQETKYLYLSGTGNDHTVNWQFYCTAGQNSGKWTTIPVPSNWELQGFGVYNYGLDKDTIRGKEMGLYKYTFSLPSEWKDRIVNIVFEGSMTDTEVKINGKSAGPIHQGSFYCFKYNITPLLNQGKKNLLEVTVAKHSANKSVNAAERKADYWIFGGIFRPVYLEALPQQHINRVALNAKANGVFTASVYLGNATNANEIEAQIYKLNGEKAGDSFKTKINKGDTMVNLKTSIPSPLLWSPESPNLYQVIFSLTENNKTIHSVKERFGFRTIELRERDGIYVNGTLVKFKGVCRHSFWPTSGRTTSKKLSITDVELMKDMNMNAVRMSHYPPDAHFLDVCDSLGLFVLDEVAGWHHNYDTETGSKLVKEMVAHDVNHPSIIIWDNGNEGGHNFDLDPVFDQMDIQQRPVIHPWAIFRGTDTQHYINYDYGNGTHLHGHNIVFPTEFLHGLYDGGLGAGLEDYWEQMWHSPLSAGGFLWVFADEGVVRTDKKGIIDTDGDHAPDGILGPYHEKEGSYFTIKEVWSPIYFERREITPAFDGSFRLQNRFLYTNINQCSFTWKLVKTSSPFNNDTSDKTGTVSAPNILPGQSGSLNLQLPENWKDYAVLYVTAYDAYKRNIFTWSWPVSRPEHIARQIVTDKGSSPINVTESDSFYTVTANHTQIIFNRKTGTLQKAQNEKGVIPFGNGPILCEGEADFQSMSFSKMGENIVIENTFGPKSSFKEVKWIIYPSGWMQMDTKYWPVDYESTLLGISFSYPESAVKSIRWMGDGPYRVWKNRMKGTNLNVWEKAYNNTMTGVTNLEYPEFKYPEFKGYYSNFYWLRMTTASQPFTIVCSSEDIFLRLYTPQSPKVPYNTAPAFPSGDISFMHGITPIGTKGQKAEKMGPMGQKHMFYTSGKDYYKEITLYFDFTGK